SRFVLICATNIVDVPHCSAKALSEPLTYSPRITGRRMLQVRSTNTSIRQLLNNVICGDAYDLLGLVPEASVDLIITSPPYWGHRDYDLEHNWELLNDIESVKKIGCRTPGYQWYRANGGILGLEPYPEWYVVHLAEIFQRAFSCL